MFYGAFCKNQRVLDIGAKEPYPRQGLPRITPMVVADIGQLFLNYLDYRRGKLPHPKIAEEMEERLIHSDPQLRDKLSHEFDGLAFVAYEPNHSSICQGDSGLPALIAHKGRLGIVGLASAVSQLEDAQNPSCAKGSTSIFTTLNRREIVSFLEEAAPEAVLY